MHKINNVEFIFIYKNSGYECTDAQSRSSGVILLNYTKSTKA